MIGSAFIPQNAARLKPNRMDDPATERARLTSFTTNWNWGDWDRSGLSSLLTKQHITALTAMTGEITLSGNVLPVGGIKEKVLAAKRAGVKDVILPAENKMNVEEDLTPEQLENLNVHYVKTIDEALRVSLPTIEESAAAKIIPAAPPQDAKQEYQPTKPVKEPEPVHDRVLTQA